MLVELPTQSKLEALYIVLTTQHTKPSGRHYDLLKCEQIQRVDMARNRIQFIRLAEYYDSTRCGRR